MSESQPTSPYLIPGAIIVAGLLIAGSVFMSGDRVNSPGQANVGQATGSAENAREVSAEDHILGDINAPVKIIEYSDLECPFCKRFHETMKQVMEEYGDSGQVAWIYRHFPLSSIHPGALPASLASECAAELGGNLSFWEYVDTYFETTNSDNTFDEDDRMTIATNIGLEENSFRSCLAQSDKFNDKIAADTQNAIDAGGQGTPYSVIVAQDGTKTAVSGAVPLEQMRSAVEAALGN